MFLASRLTLFLRIPSDPDATKLTWFCLSLLYIGFEGQKRSKLIYYLCCFYQSGRYYLIRDPQELGRIEVVIKDEIDITEKSYLTTTFVWFFLSKGPDSSSVFPWATFSHQRVRRDLLNPWKSQPIGRLFSRNRNC